MRAPNFREEVDHAPGPVRRRQRRSWLQRNWLTSALVFVVGATVVWAGSSIFEAEQRLGQVRETRLQMEQQLQQAERRYQALSAELEAVSSARAMELQAKKFGFAKPNEKIYQTGPGINP